MGHMRRVKAIAAAGLLATIGLATQAQALPIGVPSANPWGTGPSGSGGTRAGTPPNVIVPTHQLHPVAVGTDPLENPSGVITTYGNLSNGTPTEPDENTYLVFPDGLTGPTDGYAYGKHFLFQGHENAGNLAYITRVNLDVKDPAHRITLLSPVDASSGLTNFNSIDGSSYDPVTGRLLFTEEAGNIGGVIEVGPSGQSLRTLYGQLGRAGYEGVHSDNLGNVYLAEDAGGTSVNVDPNNPSSPKAARQPNSFIFRYLPYNPQDLGAGGKLQALQVRIGGNPVVFHANDPVGDTFSQDQLNLHTLGTSYPVRWVTVHDTAVDGTASFDANLAAKAAKATPFKRPENLQFQPGKEFKTFLFATTGDTNADSGSVPALAARGAWGAFFQVHMNAAGTGGRIAIKVLGDATHNSFDNVAFQSSKELLATEDRGDTLHGQLNTLDSVWLYKLGDPAAQRFIALGRDPLSLAGGEDNEPTGIFVGNGSTSVADMQGTVNADVNARAFVTRQHGENVTYEIVRNFTKHRS
jgi:hypothetical protein